jgi:hypothetical protein
MPWPQNHIAALSLYWNICYEIPYLCTVTRNICPLIHHGKSISWFSRHNILWWKRAISSRVISFIKKEMYFGKTINITRPSKKTPIRYRLETIIDNAYTKHLYFILNIWYIFILPNREEYTTQISFLLFTRYMPRRAYLYYLADIFQEKRLFLLFTKYIQ